MIIIFGAKKGGVGKSTALLNFSIKASINGIDTVILDADGQCTAARFIQDRLENEDLPKVHISQGRENIAKQIQDLNNRYELVVVDLAGYDCPELRSSLIAHPDSILITVTQASQPDLDTLEDMAEIVESARVMNPELMSLILLNRCPTNFSNEGNEAAEFINDYPEFRLLKNRMCERKIYRDVFQNGLGVVEVEGEKAEKAKQEIEAIFDEIMDVAQEKMGDKK
ncbi:division plane positioning ATPase MipZ [Endozoicomonas acroporae]|uniref:division plane positioning ATPase MipZ n=1 Tax=Endozoicomonas acroporae TaxID=1701104 RepID=UPI003D7C0754